MPRWMCFLCSIISLYLTAPDIQNMPTRACFACSLSAQPLLICRTPQTCPCGHVLGVWHSSVTTPHYSSHRAQKTHPQGHVFCAQCLPSPIPHIKQEKCTLLGAFLILGSSHIEQKCTQKSAFFFTIPTT